MNTKAELCPFMPVQKIIKNSGLELNYKCEDNFVFHYVDCECCRKQTLKTASRLQIQAFRTTFSISCFCSRVQTVLVFVVLFKLLPSVECFLLSQTLISNQVSLCLKEHFSLNLLFGENQPSRPNNYSSVVSPVHPYIIVDTKLIAYELTDGSANLLQLIFKANNCPSAQKDVA